MEDGSLTERNKKIMFNPFFWLIVLVIIFYILSTRFRENPIDTTGSRSVSPLSSDEALRQPQPLISRIITYHLEGNWEIDSTVKYRRQDNTTYDKDYHYRLIVQKEPPNSGVVIHFNGIALKIVGLTKNGNEFTIQSESMIFVGDVLFEGRLIEKDKMEGTCHVAFTESRSKPTSMKFTGRRVDHFDIKSND